MEISNNLIKSSELREIFHNQLYIIEKLNGQTKNLVEINKKSALKFKQAKESFDQTSKIILKIQRDMQILHKSIKRIKTIDNQIEEEEILEKKLLNAEKNNESDVKQVDEEEKKLDEKEAKEDALPKKLDKEAIKLQEADDITIQNSALNEAVSQESEVKGVELPAPEDKATELKSDDPQNTVSNSQDEKVVDIS